VDDVGFPAAAFRIASPDLRLHGVAARLVAFESVAYPTLSRRAICASTASAESTTIPKC
jgi:hypothetical protein